MHRWKLSTLAAAAFVTAAMTSTDAAALALGPLRVESALGENLRAEITIPQATTAELNNLVAQIAPPEVFRAQGMDYSNATRAIQIALVRKPDGTASLRLTSTTPLQEPFVDVVVETQWNTGHLVRTYTLLLDPPVAQRRAPAPRMAPQVSAAALAAPPVPLRTRTTEPVPRRVPAAEPAPAGDDNLRVRAGDTAGRIANANLPAGVSLDQMLVAMLRSNPQAFINGNVNRIRAGAVVQIPSRDQALATSTSEARQIVAAQSRDFNAYRRSLASKAPQASVQAADRSASGQVQTHVADARPAADTPDKLTLSKGTLPNAAMAEENLAAQKQADDQGSRLNELQRNLTELNDLAGATPSTASASTPTNAATAPAAPIEVTAEPAAQATPTEAQAESAAPATPSEAPAESSAQATPTLDADGNAVTTSETPASTSAEAMPASEPANSAEATPLAAPAEPAKATPPAKAKTKTAQRATPPAPAAAPSLTDELMDNPLVPAGAGLIALLLGMLGYTAWKRRRAAQAAQDPSLGDSQLHADSFFGSSGGQQVNTSSANEGASTMAYAPSQLDGGGDVDPVAEADVYLAYGRDVQAEEILKEALRVQPKRLSVHVKLAEVYAKRHDIKALEAAAHELQTVSRGQGAEWQRVVEIGRQLAPNHAFFASAVTSSTALTSPPAASLDAALSQAGATDTPPQPDMIPTLTLPDAVPPVPTAPQPSDADFAALDLPNSWDSSIDLTAAPIPQAPPTLVQDTLMGESSSAQDLDALDLDLSKFDIPTALTTPAAVPPQASMDGLDLDLDSLTVHTPAPQPAAAPIPEQGLDFDLGSLELDLDATDTPAAQAQPVHNLAADPLSTKLDLAQEFKAIGDSEGARALVEEVLAEASGPLKDRARKLLSELD